MVPPNFRQTKKFQLLADPTHPLVQPPRKGNPQNWKSQLQMDPLIFQTQRAVAHRHHQLVSTPDGPHSPFRRGGQRLQNSRHGGFNSWRTPLIIQTSLLAIAAMGFIVVSTPDGPHSPFRRRRCGGSGSSKRCFNSSRTASAI